MHEQIEIIFNDAIFEDDFPRQGQRQRQRREEGSTTIAAPIRCPCILQGCGTKPRQVRPFKPSLVLVLTMQHDDRANLRNKMRMLCHNAEQPNVCYPYHPNGIFHKGSGREGKGNSTNPASPKPVLVHTQSRDNIRGKLVEQGIPPNPGPSSHQDLGPRCGELCGTLCCTNCPHATAKEDAGLTTHPANPLGKHVQDHKGTNTKRRKRMMPSADHIVKGDYAKFPKDNASNSSKGNER